MSIADFNRYNPDFESKVGSEGKYDLRLPGEKIPIFLAKKFQILDESMQLLLKQTGSN